MDACARRSDICVSFNLRPVHNLLIWLGILVHANVIIHHLQLAMHQFLPPYTYLVNIVDVNKFNYKHYKPLQSIFNTSIQPFIQKPHQRKSYVSILVPPPLLCLLNLNSTLTRHDETMYKVRNRGSKCLLPKGFFDKSTI